MRSSYVVFLNNLLLQQKVTSPQEMGQAEDNTTFPCNM